MSAFSAGLERCLAHRELNGKIFSLGSLQNALPIFATDPFSSPYVTQHATIVKVGHRGLSFCKPMFCSAHLHAFAFHSGHASKNASGQLCSSLRTIFYGVFWCDTTAMRGNGLPPQAYSRASPMSDRLSSLLNNPYFLCSKVEPWLPNCLGEISVLGPCQVRIKFFHSMGLLVESRIVMH